MSEIVFVCNEKFMKKTLDPRLGNNKYDFRGFFKTKIRIYQHFESKPNFNQYWQGFLL